MWKLVSTAEPNRTKWYWITNYGIYFLKFFIQKYPNILLIDNPHKYVPHALNIAIKQSKGKYIASLDVHTDYPVNYLKKCIDLVQKNNAANVGGTLISSGLSKKGLAISHCMSSIFGVGNSIPRIKKFHKKVLQNHSKTTEKLKQLRILKLLQF